MIAARKSTLVIIYILLGVSAAVGAPALGLEASSRTTSSIEAHILGVSLMFHLQNIFSKYSLCE